MSQNRRERELSSWDNSGPVCCQFVSQPISSVTLEKDTVTLLTWNYTCSVGVLAMDDQHGILMDAMNDLRLANDRGAGRQQIAGLLNQLIDFARMHFSSEETLMEQSGFPGLSGHRSEHERLISRLLTSARGLEHGDGVAMYVLLGFLRDWFPEHIERFDHEYGPWLNDRGIF